MPKRFATLSIIEPSDIQFQNLNPVLPVSNF